MDDGDRELIRCFESCGFRGRQKYDIKKGRVSEIAGLSVICTAVVLKTCTIGETQGALARAISKRDPAARVIRQPYHTMQLINDFSIETMLAPSNEVFNRAERVNNGIRCRNTAVATGQNVPSL